MNNLSIGDIVHLNGDTGTVKALWPGGSDALIAWKPGKSDIAGRILWCPTAYLNKGDEPCEPILAPSAKEKDTVSPVAGLDMVPAQVQLAKCLPIQNQSRVTSATEQAIVPVVVEPEKPKTRSRPIASRDRALAQASFL